MWQGIQSNQMLAIEEPNMKVKRYSEEERKEKIVRYLKKRNHRNFNKTIKVCFYLLLYVNLYYIYFLKIQSKINSVRTYYLLYIDHDYKILHNFYELFFLSQQLRLTP